MPRTEMFIKIHEIFVRKRNHRKNFDESRCFVEKSETFSSQKNKQRFMVGCTGWITTQQTRRFNRETAETFNMNSVLVFAKKFFDVPYDLWKLTHRLWRVEFSIHKYGASAINVHQIADTHATPNMSAAANQIQRKTYTKSRVRWMWKKFILCCAKCTNSSLFVMQKSVCILHNVCEIKICLRFSWWAVCRMLTWILKALILEIEINLINCE